MKRLATWALIGVMLGGLVLAQAIGLGAAIDYLEALGWEAIQLHEAALTRQALAELGEVEDLTLYGPRDPALRVGVVSFNLAGIHPHDLAAALDAEGIAVRAGHHCAQPLARRLGVVGTTRASFGVYTTSEDIGALVAGLRRTHETLGLSRLRPAAR